MKTLLLDLALRGTLVSAVVLLLDLALGQRQQPRWRRAWWLLVALAWILPFHLPRIASVPALPALQLFEAPSVQLNDTSQFIRTSPSAKTLDWSKLLFALWLGGAASSFGIIFLRTAWTVRTWSGVRLSTDPALLDLLEDCKATAGVRAPIGLVVTPCVSSPALLGWLRPRILLPEPLVAVVGREELRGILLHELAHFRSADIPLQWLFGLGQSLHWFNPLAHLATRRWIHFREVAADASALDWMPAANREAYGNALIAAIRQANPLPIPRGALALGESLQQLKLRLTMIASTQRRARLVWLTAVVTIALSTAIALPRATFAAASSPSEDAAKSSAQAATDAWLRLIDEGNFTESWNTAASSFKTAITSEKWNTRIGEARKPLGALINRTRASSLYQTSVPKPNGDVIKGEFVIEQYDSSFENLNAARETLTFTKDTDGQWRAAGYFIKPR